MPAPNLYQAYSASGPDVWYDSFEYDGSGIVVSAVGARCGKSFLAAGKWVAIANTHVVLSFNNAIDTRFLWYGLNDEEFWVKSGTAQPFVVVSKSFERTFAIPPRAEQTRIVAKLEELLSDLDAGVAELKAAQQKLTQYRQSLLKAAVEGALTAEWRKHNPPREIGTQLLDRILHERRQRWEAKQLAKFKEQGKTPPKNWQSKYLEPVQPDTTDLPELPEGWVWASIAQVSSDEPYSLAIGPFGSNLKVSDYRESGVPLVFVRNIRSGQYGGSFTKFVSERKAEELKAHSVTAGDVLITKMGEPPGDADVYPKDQPPAIITADCIKVRCWPGLVEADFLAAVINSHIGKKQIEPMTKGVAQKKVSLGRFSTLAVPIPPNEEQVVIVKLLITAREQADLQLAALELSLKQSAAQRKNILKAAFSGQLVPQDPNDEPASALLERIRAERTAHSGDGKRQGRKRSYVEELPMVAESKTAYRTRKARKAT